MASVRNDYGITLEGFLIATVTGMCLGSGYSLVKDPSSSKEIILKRAQGGGLFVLGLYLWAPTSLRMLWLGW